jgi:hypothetical protein
MKSPIFVLGTQRSGTTLLCRMLSAHPDIFIQNELNVRRMFAPGWTSDDILNAIEGLIQEDHGKSLEAILEQSHKHVWGLKDPELTYHLHDLEKFLPESKVVVIVRDGRAVTNSYMENKWGLGTNVFTGAQRWLNEVELQVAFKENHSENVHLLRYEDLVAQPDIELVKLFEFLVIPFHEDVLQYSHKPSFYHQTRENKNTYRKPDINLTKKWQEKLSSRQKDIIETVAGAMLSRLGYPVSGVKCKIGTLEKSYYLTHQKIIGELQIQYRWRLSMIREHFRKKALNK